MLIAINNANNERFDPSVYTQDDLNHAKSTLTFSCQRCKERVMLKAGLILRPHFAHFAVCDSQYDYHPESPEHNAAKEHVAGRLRARFGANARVDLEVILPEANRIADILVTHVNGDQEAYEIQLAKISIADLDMRTDAYFNAGIDVNWYFGNNANTEANRHWCMLRGFEWFELELGHEQKTVEIYTAQTS